MNGQTPIDLDVLHGPNADTLLDPRESNPDFYALPTPEPGCAAWQLPTHFHNSGDGTHRKAVWSSLVRLKVPNNRIFAYGDCGTRPWVAQTNDADAKFVVCSNRCHDRFCPGCARIKAATIAENIHRWIRDRRVRFLTLTLKGGQQPLHVQLSRLYASFRKLRETVLWKRCVRGGAAFLEVKIGKNSGMWHPHLHVLVEGKYINIRELKPTWERITCGSHQVDIQDVRDKEKAAKYVCKYVSKPFSFAAIRNADQLDELLHTLSGTHAALTFGVWRGCRLTKRIDDRTYTYIMSVEELQRRVDAKEQWATEIWNQLAVAYGKPERMLAVPIEVKPQPPPNIDAEPRLFETHLRHFDR